MNRTFHHNFSLQGIATIVLLAVAALWCFLVRSGITPALGFVCLLIGAAGVDRLVHHIHIHRRRQPRDSTWQTWQEHNYCRQRDNSGTCGARHIVHGAPHRDRIWLRKDNLCTAAADKRIHRRNTSQAKAGISIEYSQKPK